MLLPDSHASASSFVSSSSFAAELELRVPWTNADIKSLGVYSECAGCGHSNTRWHRKREIETANKKDKKNFRKATKAYDEKIARGEKANPPKRNQQSLQVVCCCFQKCFFFYGGISCGICRNGTCEICTCSCSFVC